MKVVRALPARRLLAASALQLAMRCCGVTGAVAVWLAKALSSPDVQPWLAQLL